MSRSKAIVAVLLVVATTCTIGGIVLLWLSRAPPDARTMGLPAVPGPFAGTPFPLLGDGGRSLFFGSSLGVVLLAVASAGSLVARYQSAIGVERQQLKWLAFEAVLIAIAACITGFAQAFAPDFKPAQVLFIIALALMPVAIGIAVLRYRL